MTPRYESFPVQDKPLYDFYIDNGRLIRKVYTRYQIETIRGKLVFKIHVYGGMKTKECPGQLDKVLNNHLWTLDPDPSRAVMIFLERAESDKVKAMAMLESAKQNLADIMAAAQGLVAGEVVSQ